jgi:hypothetical protein
MFLRLLNLIKQTNACTKQTIKQTTNYSYGFDPELQQKILQKLLDVKDTAKIVTLRSLNSIDKKPSNRNLNSIDSIYDVEEVFPIVQLMYFRCTLDKGTSHGWQRVDHITSKPLIDQE